MDQVDTLHIGRYWSEVLCCTIMTHLGDLEFKVTDFEILCKSFAKSVLNCILMDLVDILLLDNILMFYAVAS